MRKSGYRSYHGRMSGGKRVAIIVMATVLALAVIYLASQHFMVYDDAGGMQIRWPFAKDGETSADELPEDDLEIIIGSKEENIPAPQRGELAPLAGVYLGGDIASITNEGKAFVLEVKDGEGRIRYPSALTAAQEAGAVTGDEADAAALETMLASYGVARISAVRDNYYPLYRTVEAGLCREGNYPWRAFDACYYLDPAKSEARSYVAAIAKECVALGFDEVLLSDIGYPADGEGRLYRILYPQNAKVAVGGMLVSVGGAVHGSGAAFSVELPSEVVLSGADEVRGVDLKTVLAAVDRVYVKTTAEEAPALKEIIGEAADFVAVLSQDPSADYVGNYVVVK